MAIRRFRHKGLSEVFASGRSAKIGAQYRDRVPVILDFLNGLADLKDCAGVKGFHPLLGDQRGRYAMRVSGNYRITFGWNGTDVTDVDFEDYH